MLKYLGLQNFKVHKNTQIELGYLTILCGKNSSGKSSFLQAILLLKQNYGKFPRQDTKIYFLNNDYCELGKGYDILFQNAENNTVVFNFEKEQVGDENKNSLHVVFDTSENKDFVRVSDESHALFYTGVVLEEPERNAEIENIFLSFGLPEQFQYLSCKRVSDYTASDWETDRKQLSSKLGKGDLTAQYLEKWGDKIFVIHELRHDEAIGNDLLNQVIAWQQEISPGVQIIPKKIGNAYDIAYSYSTPNGPMQEMDKANVGFGLSYSLPVLVAILAAKPGSLLLIENPEDHLHPSAAHKMAELLCRAASVGIQIIVETHNDHIVNGTLVNIKRTIVDAEKVKIWYFDRNPESLAAEATEIKIGPDGQISYPPDGFFDQIRKDRKVLMGF